MVRLYGKPTKFIRHVSEETQSIDAGEIRCFNFWRCADNATSRSDGQDIEHTQGVEMPQGSRVTKHKLDILVEPSTIEPQPLYLGRLTLSFNDVLAEPIMGQSFSSTGARGTVTESNTSGEYLRFYPDNSQNEAKHTGTWTQDIEDYLLDDKMKHYINFKKVNVFDQRPLISERFQRIPSKVKRINPYTWYGMIFHNDSETAGETVKIRVKQYIEEWAL